MNLQLQEAKRIAISTLEELNRKPDKRGNYPYMLIASSNYNRTHIYRCPVFDGQIIIRETKDHNPEFSRVVSVDRIMAAVYIESLDAITYVSITEVDTFFDTMRVLYEV